MPLTSINIPRIKIKNIIREINQKITFSKTDKIENQLSKSADRNSKVVQKKIKLKLDKDKQIKLRK